MPQKAKPWMCWMHVVFSIGSFFGVVVCIFDTSKECVTLLSATDRML